jgi:hypothetical protein
MFEKEHCNFLIFMDLYSYIWQFYHKEHSNVYIIQQRSFKYFFTPQFQIYW